MRLPEQHGMKRAFDSKRVETFSDAVLAVAITLMVLRIAPPAAANGQTVGEVFLQETVPAIIYFFITFYVIVVFWMHHHDIFRDAPEMLSPQPFFLNMAFLSAVCLLPLGLEFLTTGATYLTLGVYAGLMALCASLLGALSWSICGRRPVGSIITAGVFLVAIPFAGILGSWAPILWLLRIPISRNMSTRHFGYLADGVANSDNTGSQRPP